MWVKHVINNNAISAVNRRDQERILTGKGVGFKVKPGDPVDTSKVEKEYVLKSQNISGKLYALLAQTPEVYIEIADEIVRRQKETIQGSIDDMIFLNLIDHISFAVSRLKKGFAFHNALLWEIKTFYPKEFEVARYGLELIEAKTGYKLPEDEAAAIAMHLVNSELDYKDISDTIKSTELIHKIINVVRYQYHMNFDEDSIHYTRFVTHLKFFAQRLFQDKMLDGNDAEFHSMICQQYHQKYTCAQRIAKMIWNDYQISIPEEELVYLTVYIERITSTKD